MHYQGICNKYGTGKVFAVAYTFPFIAHGVMDRVSFWELSSVSHNVALTSAFLGTVSAVFAHELANKKLKNKGVGMSRGAGLVKKAQAAAYAIPVACGLGINVGNVFEREANPKCSQITQPLQGNLVVRLGQRRPAVTHRVRPL